MKQIIAITLMNLRNIPSRLGSSLVIVVGIAGVVGVLVGMLSMTKGFDKTLKGTGSESRAILLSAGVTAELSSGILNQMVPLVRELPGIKKDVNGKPITSAELMVITEIRKTVAGERADVNVGLRGVEPMGLTMRPEVKIVEGRMFTPGLHEVIAGRKAQQQFTGIEVGRKLQFRGSEWTVAGIFTSNEDAHESELWADADTARSTFGRTGASSILVELDGANGLKTLQGAIKADPRLQLDAQTEPTYFTSQSQNFTTQIGILTTVVAAIMAVGALFGALNTMYSAVSTRQVEIATLRAIGFSGMPVVISVLTEALVLSLVGGLAGATIAYVLFNGMTVSTLGQNFTQVAFSFAVTPDLVQKGVYWAVLIGLVGGFFPAIRAARLPVVDALRAQ